MCRFRRHNLKYIPVLDDLPGFIESEDVDSGVLMVTGPILLAMENDVVAPTYCSAASAGLP
jgi:hypothetical protein